MRGGMSDNSYRKRMDMTKQDKTVREAKNQNQTTKRLRRQSRQNGFVSMIEHGVGGNEVEQKQLNPALSRSLVASGEQRSASSSVSIERILVTVLHGDGHRSSCCFVATERQGSNSKQTTLEGLRHYWAVGRSFR